MVFSWNMGEELAVAHMREMGFADSRRSTAGPDGGLDVVSTRAVAQVKHLAQPVGSPDVQRLYGAAHGVEYALFYSSSGYTAAAVRIAEQIGIALFQYDTTNNVRAVNSRAATLTTDRSIGFSPDERLAELREAVRLWDDARVVMLAFQFLLRSVQEGATPPWAEMVEDMTSMGKFMEEAAEERTISRWESAVANEDTSIMLSVAKQHQRRCYFWFERTHLNMEAFAQFQAEARATIAEARAMAEE